MPWSLPVGQSYPPLEEDEAEQPVEELKDAVKFVRVDTKHADVTIPRRTRTMDKINIEIEGKQYNLNVPHGEQGNTVRFFLAKKEDRKYLKAEKAEKEAEKAKAEQAAAKENRDEFTNERETSDADLDEVRFTRVDSKHADVTIPRRARTMQQIVIELDGVEKELTVPKGEQGNTVRYLIVAQDKKTTDTPMCGFMSNLPWVESNDSLVGNDETMLNNLRSILTDEDSYEEDSTVVSDGSTVYSIFALKTEKTEEEVTEENHDDFEDEFGGVNESRDSREDVNENESGIDVNDEENLLLEPVSIVRVDTKHADVTIPQRVRTLDVMSIEQDGIKYKVKVPKGEQGKTVRYNLKQKSSSTCGFSLCFG